MQENAVVDPWTGLPLAAEALAPKVPRQASGLSAEVIDGVVPLEREIGADLRKTVPDALRGPLFGGVGAMSAAGTFAVLDAAKTVNLPEMLEDSGLDHRCLFKGAAFEQLGNVAPWIVRLDEQSKLTRNLFTRSDAAWHLWGRFSGMFIRADAGLDDLWRHFRKFTQLRDEHGQTLYLRFWDKAVLNAARRARGGDSLYQTLVGEMHLIWHSPEADHPNRFRQLSRAA